MSIGILKQLQKLLGQVRSEAFNTMNNSSQGLGIETDRNRFCPKIFSNCHPIFGMLPHGHCTVIQTFFFTQHTMNGLKKPPKFNYPFFLWACFLFPFLFPSLFMFIHCNIIIAHFRRCIICSWSSPTLTMECKIPDSAVSPREEWRGMWYTHWLTHCTIQANSRYYHRIA